MTSNRQVSEHTAPLTAFWPRDLDTGELDPIVECDGDRWIARGHLTPDEFRAVYLPEASKWYSTPAEMPDDVIRQAWAVIDLADPEASVDEVSINTAATWATPGAVKVTVGIGEPGEPFNLLPGLRVVRGDGA